MTGRDDLRAVVDCLRDVVELEAVVLFGSRARDDAFSFSDWDLAVVSSDFQGMNPLERGLRTVDCRRGAVELVHLTPVELETPDYSYLRCAILEEGEPIVDAGVFAAARRRYEERKERGEIEFRGDSVRFRGDDGDGD